MTTTGSHIESTDASRIESHSRLALVSTGRFVVGFIASWVAYRKWLPWDI